MLAKTVTLPIVLCVEENLLHRIPQLISSRGLVFNNPLILTGRGRTRGIGEQLVPLLKTIHPPSIVKDASLSEAERIKKRVQSKKFDSIFAVGGGKVIDAGKYAASSCGINLIAIPTAVSNDGIASPIAVIENGGLTESKITSIPTALIADLSIIEKAPIETTKSGIGDLLSNFSSVLDWQISAKETKEQYDSFVASISRSAALKLFETSTLNIKNHDFLRSLIEGLIMSGMAMNIHGSSRPSSGAEHMISHALDTFYGAPGTHGEQCGVASLFTLAMHNKLSEKIRILFDRLELKKSPSDLGITKKEFLFAVQKGPSMRPGRYTILNSSNSKSKERAYEIAFNK